MQEEKIYIKPGMDCYSEWKEGLGEYKRAMMGTSSTTAKRLDEWASTFNVSISALIEMLGAATFIKDRGGAA